MSAWPADTGRLIVETTDSTNAEAQRRLGQTPPPFWLLARTQTAGKGRRGRAWLTGQGAFTASSALTLPPDPARAALRSFTAALALAETFEALSIPPDRIALKWPNDVLLDGGKVAGILLESLAKPHALTLIVGIGINLRSAPDPETLEPGATPPRSLDTDATPEAVLDLLAPSFATWETRLATQGFPPIRAAWLARAARLGQPITARLSDRQHTGIFRTVDDTGAVVLDTPTGTLALPAAEIHF